MDNKAENNADFTENRNSKPISEDGIKRAVVPFLKNFYKNRYAISYGTEKTEFDLVDAAGHRIDSRITFQKEDGAPFTCAIEATSMDKLEEVRFSLNQPYFLWECAASAGLSVGILYLFLWRFRGEWVFKLGWQGNIGLTLAIGCMAFLVFYFSFKNRQKFRYIYAVEQFKNYAADEQWVALTENAFPNHEDKYLFELRNQLIFNGFGLLLVADDGHVRALVTPSRLGQFGGARRTFDFFLEKPLVQNAARILESRPAQMLANVGKKGWQLARVNQIAAPTTRYMKSFFHQKVLLAIGLMIAGIVIWRTRSYRTIEFASEKNYDKSILTREIQVEDDRYMPGEDVRFSQKPAEYLQNAPESEPDLSGEPISKTKSDSIFLTDMDIISGQNVQKTPVSSQKDWMPTASKKVKKTKITGCEIWANRKGWIVQDNYFSDVDFAKARAKELANNGFSVEIARRNCLFQSEKTGWITLIGGIFSEETSARNSALIFQKKLKTKKLERKPILVKKLFSVN